MDRRMLASYLLTAFLASVIAISLFFLRKRSVQLKKVEQDLALAQQDKAFWQRKYFQIREEMHDRFGE